MIEIKKESDRLPEAVRFAQKQIDEINRQLHEYDYCEDIDGKLFYFPGDYQDEKEQLLNEKRNWEIMFRILTEESPVSILDW